MDLSTWGSGWKLEYGRAKGAIGERGVVNYIIVALILFSLISFNVDVIHYISHTHC